MPTGELGFLPLDEPPSGDPPAEGSEEEEDWSEENADHARPRLNDPLRNSILKPGLGPVVSPRTPMTRTLSFSDQVGKPLKDVRLYERDLNPHQQMRALHQQQQEEERA